MKLLVGASVLDFVPIELEFHETGLTNLFANKNNKTLAGTVAHRRYVFLSSEARRSYPDSLNEMLGDFLFSLKKRQDPFYRKFLNPYGDLTYCRFSAIDSLCSRKRGLYCFVAGESKQLSIKYVGKTTDSFRRRINQGYGQIPPKNCYLDGQATNCRLNALIAASKDRVGMRVCPLEDECEITQLEQLLMQRLRPVWNIGGGACVVF